MQTTILILISIFFLYVFKTYSRSFKDFVFLIPVVNALTDMTIGYSNEKIFAIFSIIRASLIYGVIFMVLRKNLVKKDPMIWSILIAVSYYFLTVFFSSNILLSLNSYLRMIVSLFMVLVGYYAINNQEDLMKINRLYLWSLFILILNFSVAQVFKIGSNPYDDLETQFYLGGGGVQLITSLPFILFTFPFALQYAKKPLHRYIYLFLSIIAVLIVMIAMKRIVVAALAIGFAVFFYYSFRSKKILFSLILVFALLYITLPFYENILTSRTKRLEDTNIREEKQAKDFNWWLTDLKENHNIIFFGREFLNSRDTIGKGQRGLHVDYLILLHGTGIIGLLLYFNILWQIIRKFHRLNKVYKSNFFFKASKTTFWALIFCMLTVSFSGGLVGITARSYAFLYLGVILGYFEKLAPLRQEEFNYTDIVNDKIRVRN